MTSSRILATVLALAPLSAVAMPGRAAAPATAAPPAAEAKDAAAAEVNYAYLKAPLFAPEFAAFPAAQVEDEVITVGDFVRALGEVHQSHAAGEQAGKTDFNTVLDRLVDGRLFVLEARDMGIDDLPEVKKAVAAFEEDTQRELMQARAVKDAKADPKDVERIFKDSVREWKIMSALFGKEEDAKRVAAEAQAGEPFEDLLKQAAADKQIKSGGDPADFVPEAKLLPQVLEVVAGLKDGGVSAPIKLSNGWTVLKMYEVRYPEDARARAAAEAQALRLEQRRALVAYYGVLIKKRVKVQQKVLNSLDYEAKKPGLDALQKDQRVVARIEGAEPITVADLSKALVEQFFHGFDRAVKEKKVNKQVVPTLDALVSKKVVPAEARREGIPGSPEYKEAVAEYTRGLLFSKFIEKVLVPEVKLPEDDLKQYHAQHKAEYAYPGFYRLQALAFGNVKDAQAALDKLRGGTDFKWLNANTEGQLPEAKRTLHLQGTLLAASALPDELRKTLSGAQAGDHRLFAAEGSQFYVVRVDEAIPARERPYEEAREEIRKKLFGERLTAAAKEWAGKMRKARDVKVYLTRIGS